MGDIPRHISKPQPLDRGELPGQVVLVMQGGGAPGVYQAGAYEALHDAGVLEARSGDRHLDRRDQRRPSSPAIRPTAGSNGSGSSGRAWPTSGSSPGIQLAPLVWGVPGFYFPNPMLARGVDANVGIERAALYYVDPLKKLLPTLVDFDRMNSGKPRFTLGLVTVRSRQMRTPMPRREGRSTWQMSAPAPSAFIPRMRIDGEWSSTASNTVGRIQRRSARRAPWCSPCRSAFARIRTNPVSRLSYGQGHSGTQPKAALRGRPRFIGWVTSCIKCFDMPPDNEKDSPKAKELGRLGVQCRIMMRSMPSPSTARTVGARLDFSQTAIDAAGRPVTDTSRMMTTALDRPDRSSWRGGLRVRRHPKSVVESRRRAEQQCEALRDHDHHRAMLTDGALALSDR